jgi:hypothetical protein
VREEETPTIVARAGRDGYRATIPALGKKAFFGPGSKLAGVMAAAKRVGLRGPRS